MKTYQISASIVVYENDPTDVLLAIRSVLSAPLKVVCTVVDNSPTQSLRQAVVQSGANYIFVGKNLGFGAGHNVVLRKSGEASEYHLVLNPDVSFSPESLVSLYQILQERQDIGLIMPKILYPDGREQRLCKLLPSPLDLLLRRFLGGVGDSLFAAQLSRYELRHANMEVPREVPNLSGCFMLISSEALREVGLFDERYFMYMEDVDLCRRIGCTYKTVFYPKVEVVHGYAKGSYFSKKLLKYHMQSAFKYFSKWGWIYDPDRSSLNEKTSPIVIHSDVDRSFHISQQQNELEIAVVKAQS